MSRRDGRSARDARQLLERGAELARIEQFIADLARGQGGMLVIQGAAGIGKSALLGALCERAGGQGMQTLTARTSELEQAWSFGVVRQLLESQVVRADAPERAELLAGAAKLAGPVLGLGGKVGDSFAALHGLYWLMANLTIGAPVVAAIDDLQWADEPSLRWLAAKPDPAFVTACTEITGGNPFALHELMLDLAADGIEPTAAQAAVVAERVPAGVERAVLARLGRLDHAAQRLAQAVAVLGEDSGLRLAARMAELDIDTAAAAADALLTAELLAEGRPLRFAHPLVRSAVYQQLAPSARPWAHGRAARLLLQEGTELEKVAAQLLLSEPVGDLDAVQALRGAAAAALARGAPQTAGGYLRRALAEPLPQPGRAAILGELGTAERIGRDPAALIHLEQAWQATGEPFARARLADQLADVLFYAGDSSAAARSWVPH
jgi:predicted ATPase